MPAASSPAPDTVSAPDETSQTPDATPEGSSDAPQSPAPPPVTRPVATPVVPSSGTLADQARISELTAILNTATDGVLIIDGDGKVEELNSSAQALFAMDESEAKGRSFTELLLPQSWQNALDYLSGLRGSGVASLLNEGREVVGKCGQGSIALFMTMGRISDAGSGRFCAVLRDITQWKHTEADLVAARKKAEDASSQKSDFLARVSHEIRTPLNAIIGFADVMIDERFGQIGNNRYREYMRDIRMSGEHVVNLVNDLLDISKIEAGKIDLNFTAVPLNDLVRECMSLMQPQANKNHVVLRSSLVSDIPAIVADQTSLRQIVLNLLSNSVKFTRSGGQVIASTSLTRDGEAELRIRDNGEGMGEDELARAMEPFRQLSTASIGSQAGTGLGLPLTKALVEANRARFSIESARGEGTIVKVTFPPTRVLSE
ncbi:MAG: ATP-binding protein [Alphaproteobacteria bacterium]